VRLIVITAPWDHYSRRISRICSKLEGCIILYYYEEEALKLILKYGIDGGMVRIPQFYIEKEDGVVRLGSLGEVLRIMNKSS